MAEGHLRSVPADLFRTGRVCPTSDSLPTPAIPFPSPSSEALSVGRMNLVTGVSPSWRRNAYCRLPWTKRSGAKLEMLWRLTQGYYRDGGWSPQEIDFITVG